MLWKNYWQMMSDSEHFEEGKKAEDNSDSTDDLMAISGDAVTRVSLRKTIRF